MEHEITVMPFVSIIHHHPQRRANPTHTRLCVCPEQGANGGGGAEGKELEPHSDR